MLTTAALSLLGGVGGWHGLMPGIAWAASPPFVPQPPARYLGDGPGNDMRPETLPDTIQAHRWPVDVTIQPPLCDVNGRYSWSSAGRPLPSTRTDRCRYTLSFPNRGDYSVTLTAQIGAQHRTATAVIHVRGWLVVTIGDSIASGEGVPDVPGRLNAQWQSRQCHRSARAAPSLAAQTVQQSTDVPLTFVSLACSGASIETGLLAPYEGQVPQFGSMLPDQLAVLRNLAGRRHVDALMISIGANDLHFSGVIKACAPVLQALRPLRLLRNCFDEAAPWDKQHRTLSAAIEQAVVDLGDRYARLNAELRTISVGHVLLLQYFDPLNGADGKTCRSILGIKRPVLDMARQSVLTELNKIGHAAALKYHWGYVDGIRQLFARHGYCAKKAGWVVTSGGSTLNGNGLTERVSEILHPNAAGHQEIATLVAPKLAAALRVSSLHPTAAAEVSTPVADGLGAAGLLGSAGLVVLGFRRTAHGRHARRDRTTPGAG